MRLTIISDTHGMHKKVTPFLDGGDAIIHAGDLSGRGDLYEIDGFAGWYHKLENYRYKIFIAGNHDIGLEDNNKKAIEVINDHGRELNYLQDEKLIIKGTTDVLVWGSPWQPEFLNWAFNLPRNGQELEDKWNEIPEDVDILITHGPPFGILDYAKYSAKNVGCEKLLERVLEIKPKIHIFGHIHEGAGYQFNGDTHFINASVLNERYEFRNRPLIVDWDPETNKLEFIEDKTDG